MSDKPLPFEERVHATQIDNNALYEPYPGHEVCDFCLSTAVAGYFDAGEVRVEAGKTTHVSEDGWNACETCRKLVEADDLDKLARRAIDGIKTRQDEPGQIDLVALMVALGQFLHVKGGWHEL